MAVTVPRLPPSKLLLNITLFDAAFVAIVLQQQNPCADNAAVALILQRCIAVGYAAKRLSKQGPQLEAVLESS